MCAFENGATSKWTRREAASFTRRAGMGQESGAMQPGPAGDLSSERAEFQHFRESGGGGFSLSPSSFFVVGSSSLPPSLASLSSQRTSSHSLSLSLSLSLFATCLHILATDPQYPSLFPFLPPLAPPLPDLCTIRNLVWTAAKICQN
ncbi:uncharacterized protein [Physcomitrium patens]|uniref:uncharacterized protein n=1 Tax=Physcomitrium patens TaxID=3218 RepID=UPI003CCC9D50